MTKPLRLTECDREPIHIPGAVQPHGALLALDPAAWTVTHASANLQDFLGMEAAAALGQPLPALLGEEVASVLRQDVQARRASAGVMLAGVDAVQGYVLARPMTGEAAVAEACQAPGERAWYGHLDAARRLAAEVQSTGG
jgi:hypothetical protein